MTSEHTTAQILECRPGKYAQIAAEREAKGESGGQYAAYADDTTGAASTRLPRIQGGYTLGPLLHPYRAEPSCRD